MRGLAAVGHVSLALTAAGVVVAWEHNAAHALGDPEDRTSRHTAMPVAGLADNIIAISYGLALRADGTVMQWGDGLPTNHQAWDDGLPVGTTKMGGRPDLPKSVRWPRADGRPMTFLAQIALADVAAHDTSKRLPARGRLAVFCDLEDPQMAAASVLQADTGELARPVPPRGAAPKLDGAVTLEPAPELALCPVGSELVLRLGLSQEEYWTYVELVDPHDEPRHRMLGHPDVVQDDRAATRRSSCCSSSISVSNGSLRSAKAACTFSSPPTTSQPAGSTAHASSISRPEAAAWKRPSSRWMLCMMLGHGLPLWGSILMGFQPSKATIADSGRVRRYAVLACGGRGGGHQALPLSSRRAEPTFQAQ